VIATGGIVPPALQGHTPDIALRHDPAAARELLGETVLERPLRVESSGLESLIAGAVAECWHEVLGIDVEVVPPGGETRPDARVDYWLPGYADPEYYLRLLLHSGSALNDSGFAHPGFDDLIERARRERDGRTRLELYHSADRLAVAEEVARVPRYYARSLAVVKPSVSGWWEFGKSCASFADLVVSPRVT
jgi:oligopeptide transport system substrate-binding protein